MKISDIVSISNTDIRKVWKVVLTAFKNICATYSTKSGLKNISKMISLCEEYRHQIFCKPKYTKTKM